MPAPADNGAAEQDGAFDHRQLGEMVNEIGGYLAELRHIDLVLTYRDAFLETPYMEPPDEQDLAGNPGISSTSYYEKWIHLGETYPFAIVIPVYAAYGSEVEKAISQLSTDARTWAADRMRGLNELVRPIAFPVVSTHDSVIDKIQAVYTELRRVRTDFGELNNNLSSWTGDAAENFADHFYEVFPDALSNQRAVLIELISTTAVSKAIINYSQQSLMNAISSARETLREQLLHRSLGSERTSIKEFLSVTSTVTGAVGLLLTSYPPLGIPLSALSTIMGVASLALPEEAVPQRIEAKSAEGVEAAISLALAEIKNYVDRSYDELYQRLNNVRIQVNDLLDRELLLPARPDLADSISGEDFHHVTSSRYTG